MSKLRCACVYPQVAAPSLETTAQLSPILWNLKIRRRCCIRHLSAQLLDLGIYQKKLNNSNETPILCFSFFKIKLKELPTSDNLVKYQGNCLLYYCRSFRCHWMATGCEPIRIQSCHPRWPPIEVKEHPWRVANAHALQLRGFHFLIGIRPDPYIPSEKFIIHS